MLSPKWFLLPVIPLIRLIPMMKMNRCFRDHCLRLESPMTEHPVTQEWLDSLSQDNQYQTETTKWSFLSAILSFLLFSTLPSIPFLDEEASGHIFNITLICIMMPGFYLIMFLDAFEKNKKWLKAVTRKLEVDEVKMIRSALDELVRFHHPDFEARRMRIAAYMKNLKAQNRPLIQSDAAFFNAQIEAGLEIKDAMALKQEREALLEKGGEMNRAA